MIDNVINALQSMALACTGVAIKRAPKYPVEDASALPFSVAHLTDGTASADNAATCRLLTTIAVDFHFSRINLANAYKQIDALAYEYSKRLAGNPTLGGTVDTIVFPVSYSVAAAEWDKITTIMLRFTIPIKSLESVIK